MFKQSLTHFKASSLPFALKITTALVGLLFNFFATQYLTIEEFGLFAIAQLFIITLATLSKFGLDTTVVKIVALQQIMRIKNTPTKSRQEIKTNNEVFILMLLVALFSIIIGFGFYLVGEYISTYWLNKPLLAALIPSISLSILPNALIAFNSGIFRGAQNANLSMIFSGLATLSLSLVLTLAFQPTSALALIQLFVLANYCVCVISLILTLNKKLWQFTIYTPNIELTLKTSSSLWFIAIVALLIQQFSTLVLAKYVVSNEIAIYVIASKIAVLMSFILVAINSVYAAKFAQLFKNKEIQELKLLVNNIQKSLLIFALIVTAIILLNADLILSIFGHEYQQGVLWLQILAIGQLINLATGSSVNLLIMTGHEATHRNNTLIVALVTLCLSFTLIPTYHALGAAITTALAMGCQNLLSYYYAHKKVFCALSVQ